ncbi:MAG TPA: antirestriction protein ArdA [Gammaproteobacteria bacterium]|nr:antirestriction protein ArdA [Gammaproteobacteria bacterium]
MMLQPKIYVACLAAYNNGYLHGRWIDADNDLDVIKDEISQMLKTSPVEDAEEYAIHDYEDFGGYQLGEYEGIEHTHELASFITEHGELGAELLNDYDIEEAERYLQEQYAGCYSSTSEFAEQLTEETTEIPSHLAFYIDYEKMARDMEYSGDIFTIETAFDEIHVFWAS